MLDILSGRTLGQSIVLASLIAGSAAFTTAATAGECPAGQMKAGVRAPVTPAKGVTDTVLAAIDLAKEPAKIKDRQLRFRKLVIEPGGIVPWHSHGDRPAIIYVAEGEIVEYASNCAVPIVHKAGDDRPRDQRHGALVEEHGQQDRRAVRGRRAARQERQEHVTRPRTRAQVTPRPDARRRHPSVRPVRPDRSSASTRR